MAKDESVFMSNEEMKALRLCVLHEIKKEASNIPSSALNELCIVLYKLNSMIEPEEVEE